MNTKKTAKLKPLLQSWPMHTLVTSRWLKRRGISYSNLEKYEKSGWVSRVSSGVFQRVADKVSWEGAVFGLQNQFPDVFYVGGKTAIELSGAAHFIPMAGSEVFLLTSYRKQLPIWFRRLMLNMGVSYHYLQYKILPHNLALTQFNCGEFQIHVSTRERAALEMAELLGRFHTFEECRLIYENLATLRPNIVQQLLEACTSIKAKRVFLFINSRLGHRWVNDLDISRIDLGSGQRDLSPKGTFDPVFQITYPKGLFEHEQFEI